MALRELKKEGEGSIDFATHLTACRICLTFRLDGDDCAEGLLRNPADRFRMARREKIIKDSDKNSVADFAPAHSRDFVAPGKFGLVRQSNAARKQDRSAGGNF